MIALLLAAALAAQTAPTTDRATIQRLVEQRHGTAARVERIIVHGDYALAASREGGVQTYDGLRRTASGWKTTCAVRSEPSATTLQSSCGFPQGVAIELSADEATQNAVARGEFDLATIAQVRAYNFSRSGPDRDQERARLQLLRQLNEQMRTGTITRAQAIQQWNQFRYSWMLP